MFTKEWDGGNMNKTVEKIVVSEEGIEVISMSEGVKSITQLSLEPEENELQNILERYNLSIINNYSFDINIVRALAESEEQLRNYLETCKKLNSLNK